MITRLAILISSLMMVAHLHGEKVDDTLRILIDEVSIKNKVKETARQIERDYENKDLVIVMVLKGSLCVVADLIREINLPFNIEAVQCSSYGANGVERGALTVYGLDRVQVHNRDVLIVDDIFDSGHTMATLYREFAKQKPHSMKSCVLLAKNVPHVTEIPDYVLFNIENEFVVGYGLDYKELYRGLPGVYVYGSK
jgi:hypoxanthine phosphoribosyltransferase